MKIIQCVQGEPEWLQARLGIPTSSNFGKIITPGGSPSKQAGAYANKLIAEYLTGGPVDEYINAAMQEGIERESEARLLYELEISTDVVQVGFITTDDGLSGTSVDGMVDNDGLVEIKNPLASTHVSYLLDGKVPTKYLPQIYGQMHVAEKEWVDFLSYYPGLPHMIVRVHRDETYIAALIRELDSFNELMDERKSQLKKLGIEPIREET